MLLKFWVGTRFVTPKGKKCLPRAIPTRSANFFVTLHTLSFIPIYYKKSKSIPTTVLKFWVGTRFVTTTTPPTTPPTPTTTTTTNDAAEDHNTLSGQSPSG